MKKVFNYCLLALSALAFAVGCSKNDNILPDDTSPKYRLTVKADKGTDNPSSKALAIEDRNGKHYLASSWETGDAIYVHLNTTGNSIGTLHPRSEGANAYLDGDISGSLHTGDYLCFSYPISSFNWDYTGQDGSLETIAQRYDYAYADAYIKSVDGSTITVDPLTFSAQQAIVKFTLVDAASNPVCPTKLTLTAKDAQNHDILIRSNSSTGNLEINIDQTTPHNEIYAALNFMGTSTAASFKLVASVGEQITYVYERNTETTFQTGKYYEIKVKLSNMTVNPSIGIDDLVFNFNFTENGSQWTKEGPVFVFFDGVTTGYYSIIHDGDGWHDGSFVDLDGTQASALLESGKVTAVYLDWGEQLDSNPVSFSNGKWNFLKGGSQTEGWKYLSAGKVPFSVAGVTVSGTQKIELNCSISLSEPSYNAIAVDPGITGTNFTKFACNNLIPAGLASISSDGTVNDVEGSAGQWINVISYYACAKLVDSPDYVYYYALNATNSSSTDYYYHLFDTNNNRLTLKGTTYPHAEISEDGNDWIQVGKGIYVTIRGTTWWTTNLSNDRHSPLPHPWMTDELVWTTTNQWDNDRVSKSLSESTFDDNSQLPEPFNWHNSDYYFNRLVSILGIKGWIVADKDDFSKFIFLPFANHSDFYFYAKIYPKETVFRYNYNWHYWAKGCHPNLLYHRKGVEGYDDRHWGYHFASTLHFPSYNDSFYPYYDGASITYNGPDITIINGRPGVPDYAMLDNYTIEPLYFPARPVKKN
ncbi:MAG: hypothetical protein IKS82_07385 [Bacteroidales bacterium]|nr:hypothetical protein [Bacteroidales bacterium]